MKKKLNIEAMSNELSGNSAFFPGYQKKEEASSPPDGLETAKPADPVPLVRVERVVPPVPLGKRVMKQRHPFDIYRDQYDALKDLALEDRKSGGVGSMSAMVREAIDRLIAERKDSPTD